MEILFKSDTQYFYLNKENTICYTHIKTYGGYVPNDLKHIKTLPIIAHLYFNNIKHEVYYIHNGRFIIKASDVIYTYRMNIFYGANYKIIRDDFVLGPIINEYKLDYTEANINRLKDGNII